jgi:nucleotide-binding universal stress UspA family protein
MSIIATPPNVAAPDSYVVAPRRPRLIRRAPRPFLVATDGRDGAAPAVSLARHLAGALGTVPQVVAVVEPTSRYAIPVTSYIADEGERAAFVRARVLDQIAIGGGPPWPITVSSGAPAATIVRLTRECAAQLVVLGIGRHRLTDRVLGEEVTRSVMRESESPVLAAGIEADGVVRRAIVGIDFDSASVRAAALALRLLAPDGVLSLVHVHARIEATHPTWQDPTGPTTRSAGPGLQRLAVALRNGTTGYEESGSAPRDDVRIGTATLFGDPASELADYAHCVGADLIAVGTHRSTFVERLVGRSVAEGIVRQVSDRAPRCSVLVCPP